MTSPDSLQCSETLSPNLYSEISFKNHSTQRNLMKDFERASLTAMGGHQSDFCGVYHYDLLGDNEGTDDSDLSDDDFSPKKPKRVLRYNPDLTFYNGISSSAAATVTCGNRNDVTHSRTDFTFCQT